MSRTESTSVTSDADAAPAKARRDKAKQLPTNRISVPKQLEILRAYVAASDTQGGPVTNVEVGKMVGMTPSTVSLANAFFTATGLLIREAGGYVPAQAVRQFARAFDWNPETAAHQLAPVIGLSWFNRAVMLKARLRPTPEEVVIADLALVSESGPEYRPHLRMLLEYLEAVGIVTRTDGKVVVAPPKSAEEAHSFPPEPQGSKPVPVPEAPRRPEHASQPIRPGIAFSISVQVDMDEIAKWSPDRIAAFFAGIAQVQAARSGEGKEKSMG